jgi:hypothetical protein
VDIATFRGLHSEFSNDVDYSDTSIQGWLDFSLLMLNASRWGSWLDKGTELFVAHNLVMDKVRSDTAAVGGWPGLNKGVLSGETPGGGVSLSYNVEAGINKDAAHWNLTTYGTQFIYMARHIGAGPIQVGADSWGPSGAWPGPLTGQGGNW